MQSKFLSGGMGFDFRGGPEKGRICKAAKTEYEMGMDSKNATAR